MIPIYLRLLNILDIFVEVSYFNFLTWPTSVEWWVRSVRSTVRTVVSVRCFGSFVAPWISSSFFWLSFPFCPSLFCTSVVTSFSVLSSRLYWRRNPFSSRWGITIGIQISSLWGWITTVTWPFPSCWPFTAFTEKLSWPSIWFIKLTTNRWKPISRWLVGTGRWNWFVSFS